MPTKVLFLGLDAADADLIDRWAAEGELPNLAALGQRHVTSRMECAAGMFPGGVWFELTSGRLAQRSGRFFETRVLRTGEARMRPATATARRSATQSRCWPTFAAAAATTRSATAIHMHPIGPDTGSFATT